MSWDVELFESEVLYIRRVVWDVDVVMSTAIYKSINIIIIHTVFLVLVRGAIDWIECEGRFGCN